MSTRHPVFAAPLIVLAVTASAIGAQSSPGVKTFADSQALTNHLRELGYKYRSGIDRATTV